MKSTNLEIYNFLNMTNHKFGKMYKYMGKNPLPDNFELNSKKIEEILILNQMQKEVFPYFSCEEKNKIKKYFKNSIKNCKKIIKIDFFNNFSKEFSEKLKIYFNMRIYLTSFFLKNFKSHTFNEIEAYREIYYINPILSEFFEELFEEKVDVEILFENLENKYKASFEEKQKLLQNTNNTQKISKKKVAKKNQ